MPLTQLQIKDFRNLREVSMRPVAGLNLLVGRNGSGKSSVLEAIHYLGLGRSFRAHLTSRVIREGAESFTLFGRVEQAGQEWPVGLSKDRHSHTQLRINGRNAERLSELAELLPFQLIHPEGFDLLNGGPQPRRAWLDWGVFHFDPHFMEVWSRVRRLLKQRQALLRSARDYRQLAYWDGELSRLSETLSVQRQAYCDALAPKLQQLCATLLPEFAIKLGFYRGWERERPLHELLEANFVRDQALGYSSIGPQRADIRLKCDGVAVQDRLSRGQLKLLICALRLVQGEFFSQSTGRSTLFLLDDFASELDAEKRYQLALQLQRSQAQLFMTAIDAGQVADLPTFASCKLFKIEQGNVSE